MVYYKEDQMTESLVLNNGKEIYDTSSYIYVVFPLQGPSLLDVLSASFEKPLSWAAKSYLCSQIVHCVKYLHTNLSVAHLDLKVENIVFTKDLKLSLIDFGMS